MKAYKYLSLASLAGVINCFDASTDYTVTTDPNTKYITLTPKAPNTHMETLLYLHGGGGSAEWAYQQELKTKQIAPLTTKIVIMNATNKNPDARLGKDGWEWFDTLPKDQAHYDILGNQIVAVQSGPGSLDEATSTILNVIDTEKDSLPEGKQSYGNISVVGFSQGAATTVATLLKYNKPEPLKSMIAYAGWQPYDAANWDSRYQAIQQQIPFLQMVGSHDASFCPLSYFSFIANLRPQIYTGDYANNLRFVELKGQSHGGVTDLVGAKMNDISNIGTFFSLENSHYDCNKSADKLKNDKSVFDSTIQGHDEKIQWCKANPTNQVCQEFMSGTLQEKYIPKEKYVAQIPETCMIWNDGCNDNIHSADGSIQKISKRECTVYAEPFCRKAATDSESKKISPIPKNCQIWNDGCNDCVIYNGKISQCTNRTCSKKYQPLCIKFVFQRAQKKTAELALDRKAAQQTQVTPTAPVRSTSEDGAYMFKAASFAAVSGLALNLY